MQIFDQANNLQFLQKCPIWKGLTVTQANIASKFEGKGGSILEHIFII